MDYLSEVEIQNNKLRNALYQLKENLQDVNYNLQTGRRPVICSEDVIEALVKYKPQSLDDMSKIRGIGDNFIENYGEEFLKLIKKEIDTNKIELSDKEKIILKKLENRLVNINRKNRLLYSSKVNKDYGLDIFKTIDDIKKFENFIVNRENSSYKLLDIEKFDDDKLKELLKLSRQVNKIINETGNNELYVAYPFVQGKMENEEFNVKAPLILFPVEILRDSRTISLKNDFSRDIIYNTNLILANNKFNGKNEILPNNKIEDFNDNYIDNMIEFYSNNDFYITKKEFKFEEFLENKVNEFPKYNNGELEIKGYMILGIYSMYVTSMFSDFHKMIENSEITKLIKELLNGYENVENNSPYQEINETKEDNNDSIEKDIYYINELDFSQEKVLKEIKHTDSLVVQGPPGTGKSQTITSLIIQSILDNKRVLMVSEKKTALDVIYSRLGELSRFSLLIDDVENKDLFYNQLNKLLNIEEINNLIYKEDLLSINNPIDAKNKLYAYIKNIDDELEKLNEISQKIYAINDFGTSYYNLYNISKRIDINDEKEYELYSYGNNILSDTINNAKYNEINEIKKFFENEQNMNTIYSYLTIIYSAPYILNIKRNLSELELIELKKDLENLKNLKIQFDEYNFIKKVFTKSKINLEISKIIDKYFEKENTKVLMDFILNNIDYIIHFINNSYQSFFINKYLYDKLNLLGTDYAYAIYKLKEKLKNEKSLIEINNYLYNLILYNKINEFEKNNTLILNYINNFDSITKNIRKNIIDKKEYTKRLAFLNLIINMQKIDDNGRINKIQEICNRKRKMSLNKFMDKFRLEMLDSIKIWLMTPEVVSDVFPFEKNMFDLLIFDESSQLYLEKAIPAIYRTNKILIAGDQKQLKPSSLGKGRILDEIDEDEIDDGFLEYESLLDAANYKYKHTMLNYHYRSKYSELISFSNYAFYNGKLLVFSNPKETLDKPPIERIMVENGRWIDKKNIEEAKEVVKLVKTIISNRKNNETIGVITFNISQMNLIEEYLEKEKMLDEQFAIAMNAEENRTENGENISFFVKNIESVQGDERDIIIFSIGYGKNESNRVAVNFGWLNQDGGENRLNVAISRAKSKIYIVTSIEPEELVVDNTKNNGPKLFKDYLRYAKAVSENNKELADSILLSLTDKKDSETNQLSYDSIFEEEVCNKLLDEGYNISTQYGVGGYRIDIIVKSKDGKDILLGIECDGKLYHSSKFARERDYHRQKYLESRGWKIYRIWSTNWWKNQNLEMAKLKEYINSIENVNKKS